MKKRLVLGLLVGVLVIAVGTWVVGAVRGRSDQGRSWQALSEQRGRIVLMRKMPSLEHFLTRQTGKFIRLLYMPTPYVGYRENWVNAYGRLLLENKTILGSYEANFYYQGWLPEPSSAEMILSLEPSAIPLLGSDSELGHLLAQTPKMGGFDSMLSGANWTSRYTSHGKLRVALRVAYPSRWMADIPEYQRGFADQVPDLGTRVVRFLVREALPEKTEIPMLALPVFNPPSSTWSDAVGSTQGFVRSPSGRLILFEIYTTKVTSPGGAVTLHLSVRPADGKPFSVAEGNALFKPEFLKRMGQTYEGGLQISATPSNEFQLVISCPYDFPIEKVKLADLKVASPIS